jgi:putative glutamine amidotransferase
MKNNEIKTIGIPIWKTGDNSWGVTTPYLHFLSQFGQVEMITQRTGIVDVDLLVLPGGMDLNPRSYGEVPGFYTGNTDVVKQFFFDENLYHYISVGIPIFSICLGFQAINVHFGGTLVQHCNFPYTERFEQKELLRLSLEGDDRSLVKNLHGYKVNSLHHQGVFDTTLGQDLVPLAYSQEHGNIEAFRHKTLPIYGVQFHSEEIHDELSRNIIHKLLK